MSYLSTRIQKERRGLSLLELVLGLFISGLVIASVMLLFMQASDKQVAEAYLDEIQLVAGAVHQTYAQATDEQFLQMHDTAMANSALIPRSYKTADSGGSLIFPDKQQFWINAISGSTYVIEAEFLKDDVCRALTYASPNLGDELYLLLTNDSVFSTSITGASNPANPSQVNAACQEHNRNTLVFYLYR